MDAPASFHVEQGMNVVDPFGATVGELDQIFLEAETNQVLCVGVQGRLVPAEALRPGGAQGTVAIAVPGERLTTFPEHEGDDLPSPDAMQHARDALETTRPDDVDLP